MNKISCIIVEDEKPAQEVLKSYIAKTEWLSLAAVCQDAVAAMEFLKRNQVDVVFLDIQIPGISGIEFLKIMKSMPQVIITTAYSEYAVEAFDLDVRDYLKKPFSYERFLRALDRITLPPDPAEVHHLENKPSIDQGFAFFNVNKLMVKVQFANVRFVESMREYVYIHVENDKIITKMGIGEMETLLGSNFLRIHRSFIVNIDKVTAYNAEEVFIGKNSLPIGTNYKKVIATKLHGSIPT